VPRSMDTLILQHPGRFEMTSRDEPASPPPGHAKVRIHRVGICGTDWHAFRGKQPFFTYPRVLGHELGVEVVEISDASSPLKPGDRCAVEPYLNCGTCVACRVGKGNCCVNLQVLGVHRDGGMQQFLIVPTDKLHPAKKLSLDQLALVETLGIGCHAAAREQVRRGENVLVIGAGPIGLSVLPFVKADGGRLLVADVSPTRLDFCQKWLGDVKPIDARQDVLKQLNDLTNGDLPTLVIDATGSPQSMMKSFEYVAHGGRLVFVGLFQGDVTFNDPNFHRREMSLLASRNALPQDFQRIIRLVEDGKIDTQPWITHRASHRQLIDVIDWWATPEANVLKAMVSFDA
jgi:2-desacetyl-2-hydroxyethyl bacteriochlorophyllide A dehydrogenase